MMSRGDVVFILSVVLLAYFIGLHLWYLLLNLFSLVTLYGVLEARVTQDLPHGWTGFEPPVTLLVPAYNEADNIVSCVRALEQLDYPEFEIIIIDDGSRDETLNLLRHELSLRPSFEASQERVASLPVIDVYASPTHPRVRVIEKENGGKPDAVNAGLNYARSPYILVTDADSLLEPHCLRSALRPFLQDPDTVESGGALRVLNGCRVAGGRIESVGLPDSVLATFQVLEYIRAYLFARMGLSSVNGVNVVSGAFYFVKRQALIDVGGTFLTFAEDTELTLHLHRHFGALGKRYRITYVPDPVCWTDVPATFRSFARQRIIWQRGLWESAARNIRLLFQPTFMGWIGFPALLVFECLGPVLEVGGYAFVVWAYLAGVLSVSSLQAFALLGIGLGGLISMTSILMEELSFRIYPRFRDLLVLSALAFLENLGFRQLNSVLRFLGTLQWLYRVAMRRPPDGRP